MSVKDTGMGYKIHELLSQNLDPLINRVKNKDRDVCILVTGREGFGKSVFAQQIAKYLDPTFDLSRITWGLKEFKNAAIKGKPCQAIQGDELLDIFAGRAAVTTGNKEMMRLLAKIRQNRLFLLLVCPSVFEIDRYAVLHRADFLVHVFSGEGDRLGYFNFYGREKMKRLYIMGKKFMDYTSVQPDFQGTFPHHYVVDEEAYREKKRKDLHAEPEEKTNRRMEWVLERMRRLVRYVLSKGTPARELARAIDVDHQWVLHWGKTPPTVAQVGNGGGEGANYSDKLPMAEGANQEVFSEEFKKLGAKDVD